jgi:hypothetical protein
MGISGSDWIADAGEQGMRERSLALLNANPEGFLVEYTDRFLNADNAATLFPEYNRNPAKHRVAVHPAAQWIRDGVAFRFLNNSPYGVEVRAGIDNVAPQEYNENRWRLDSILKQEYESGRITEFLYRRIRGRGLTPQTQRGTGGSGSGSHSGGPEPAPASEEPREFPHSGKAGELIGSRAGLHFEAARPCA